MQLFSEYVQPLTEWLHAHPSMALLITFLISFSESLAVVGSIIPGSVTMTAIGILAGSGVMRIDFTLIAASLGAIAGDSASFFLGYYFRDRLTHMWPFSKYPQWLTYGKDYFASHGGKSVLIGRFVGPLRSIIPVIAGMMHMRQWVFLSANILSGIAWSILYLGPGILIGTASSELSAESATRLFVFILLFLAILWLLGIGLKKLILYINHVLSEHLHTSWTKSLKESFIRRELRLITPRYERHHYKTALLVVAITSLFILCLLLTLLQFLPQLGIVDYGAHVFFQSIRTQTFDNIAIATSLFISPMALMIQSAAIIALAIYQKNGRQVRFVLLLCFANVFLLWSISQAMDIQRPTGLIKTRFGSSFPSFDLAYATSLWSYLILWVFRDKTMLCRIARPLLLTLLGVSALSLIYLGDNWLSDVLGAFSFGLLTSLFIWVFYRLKEPNQSTCRTQLYVLGCVLISGLLANFSYFGVSKINHKPLVAQYALTETAWWHQEKTILPLYCTNRVGHRSCLLNIQYNGPLHQLKKALLKNGWHVSEESLFSILVKRFSHNNPFQGLIWVTELYRNRTPTLTMTYSLKNSPFRMTLRLWRSNYHVLGYPQPIWIGSLYLRSTSKEDKPCRQNQSAIMSHVLPALTSFIIHKKPLPLTRAPKDVPPELYLIKPAQQ